MPATATGVTAPRGDAGSVPRPTERSPQNSTKDPHELTPAYCGGIAGPMYGFAPDLGTMIGPLPASADMMSPSSTKDRLL